MLEGSKIDKEYKKGELKSIVIQDRNSGEIILACYNEQCDDFIVRIEKKTPVVRDSWNNLK